MSFGAARDSAFTGHSAWIFGKGAHGRVVAEVMRSNGTRILGYLDDVDPQARRPEDVIRERPGQHVVVALGSPVTRALVTTRLIGMGFALAHPIVDPSAFVAPSAWISAGTVILAGAVVHTGARIHDSVLINIQAIVHHDAKVEDFVTISPQAMVCGRCVVERGSLLAIRACLMFPHAMGPNSILAADSVAHENIGEGELWVGSPAKFRRTLDLETWNKCF